MQSAWAQQFEMSLHGDQNVYFLQKSKLKKQYANELELHKSLQTAMQLFLSEGYLASSVDSVVVDSLHTAHVYYFLGNKYQWAQILKTNLPLDLLRSTNLNIDNLFGQRIEPKQLAKLMEKIIVYYENNGYPFAQSTLDSVQISDNKVSAHWLVNKGPLIKIDTMILNDDANVDIKFIQNYLNLREGEIYDERKISAMSARLRELNFIEEAFPWKIFFNSHHTTLYWYLKDKSANNADVLIGLLPNNSEIGNKFLLTGDIKFGFTNVLGYGEKLQINWQNLQYQSPRFNIQTSYPYLFNTPIGCNALLDYYKKDTTFRTIKTQLGLDYFFSAQEQIKLYYQSVSSRLLSINEALLQISKRLPENADYSLKTLGLAFEKQKVDYKLNPRKGWQASLDVSSVQRTMIKNVLVEETINTQTNTSFAYLYDNLKLKSFRYQFSGHLSYYFPIAKRLVLHPMYRFGYIYNQEPLFKNELFQIGGFRLLRGFDEGSLFVNNYNIATIETRLLLSRNSYFFLFADGGYIQRNYPGLVQNDTPYSGGLGMVFETKAGLFNMSYAAGSLGNQAIQIRNSKIHFGYVSYF